MPSLETGAPTPIASDVLAFSTDGLSDRARVGVSGTMDWIVDTELAIGNVQEAREPRILLEAGFRSVLSLVATGLGEEVFEELGLEVVTVPMIDGAGNDVLALRRAVEALLDFVNHAPPVFVHCQAGRSRSVVVVAAHLARTQGWAPERALEHVRSRRDAIVHPALVELFQRYSLHVR